MGAADSFDSASNNQVLPSRSIHTCHKQYLFSVHSISILTSCSPNDSFLCGGSTPFLSRARWILDRGETKRERVASLRGSSNPKG